uniref:Uncharacterized protein n=1 Tax=Rhizophora mucronata TaxID=61149 RepID=A0A2P2LXG6_RHIMU
MVMFQGPLFEPEIEFSSCWLIF